MVFPDRSFNHPLVSPRHPGVRRRRRRADRPTTGKQSSPAREQRDMSGDQGGNRWSHRRWLVGPRGRSPCPFWAVPALSCAGGIGLMKLRLGRGLMWPFGFSKSTVREMRSRARDQARWLIRDHGDRAEAVIAAKLRRTNVTAEDHLRYQLTLEEITRLRGWASASRIRTRVPVQKPRRSRWSALIRTLGFGS